MPLKTNLINISKIESDLKAAHRDALLDEANMIKIIFSSQMKKLLDHTIENTLPRGGRKEQGFRRALPTITNVGLYEFSDGTIRCTFEISVLDTLSGKPHKIWHYINSGTDDRVTKKAFFGRFRSDNRTSGSDLVSKTFTGYKESKWIGAGIKIKGIVARKFYKQVIEKIEKTLIENYKGFLVYKTLSPEELKFKIKLEIIER